MHGLKNKRQRAGNERGVALLMVLVMVALVSVVVVEFQYSSQVDLQLAYNARDELQAEYNALSALRVRALILRHSRKLNQVANMLMGNTGGGDGAGQLPMGQILEMLPVECGLMSALFKPLESDIEDQVEAEGFFPGECIATSSSEHSKISLNVLKSVRDGKAAMEMLYGLLLDPRLLPHFEEDDLNGTHAESPEVLIGAIVDWTDRDSTEFGSQVGDEDRHYSYLRESYETKNAPFDSVAELQLVHGVDDELYDLLKETVTIYPATAQIELGTASLDVILMGLAASLQEGVLLEQFVMQPLFPQFLSLLVEMKSFGAMGGMPLNTAAIKLLLTESALMGLVDPAKLGQRFSDKSQNVWFTIHAEGQVGNASRRFRAVFQAQEAKFYYARVE